MPGFNGTGPTGYGPMTGRGTGYRSGYDRDVDRRRFFRSRRRYSGDARGICYGIRRKFRDRFPSSSRYQRGYDRYGEDLPGEYLVENTIEVDREHYQKMHKEEVAYLKKELKEIEKRIEEMEENQDKS